MNGEQQNAGSVGIIGGADGPTSIFVGDSRKKASLKARIKNFISHHKRKTASKKIVAGSHTLDEMVLYAKRTYGATEANPPYPELPAVTRIYTIRIGSDCLDIEIDDTHDTFGVSFAGSKKAMKHFRKIAKDLYLYYGVSEDDIAGQTERYLSLLSILCL